ncbi:hypothetical protein FACS1894109_15660 [Spirochaetia bacterium]|nr:hypothetical protein FACS1894109_15660 [Spirochaetia bacterium]
MIEKMSYDDFRLICDSCGEEENEEFESFQDAVDFKKDHDNGWRAVKDYDGGWHDLCPSCNQPDIILKLQAR